MVTIVLPTDIPGKSLHLAVLGRIIDLEDGNLEIIIDFKYTYNTMLFIRGSRLKSLDIRINRSLLLRDRRNSKS